MAEYIKALYGLYVPEDMFEGQGMVEYALILALVAVVAMTILGTIGTNITSKFTEVANKLGGGGA